MVREDSACGALQEVAKAVKAAVARQVKGLAAAAEEVGGAPVEAGRVDVVVVG